MNRRQRAERKRKKRLERLRQERHQRHFGGSSLEDDEEPLSEEDAREEAQHISPFLWESALRHARLNLAIGTLLEAGVPYGPETVSALDSDLSDSDDEAEETLSRLRAQVEGQVRSLGSRTHEFAAAIFPTEPMDTQGLLARAEVLRSFLEREAGADTRLVPRDQEAPGESTTSKVRTLVLARQALADYMQSLGRTEDAIGALKVALEFDPRDELRTRTRLVGLFLLQRDLEAARSVLGDSPRPRSGAVLWGRVLERFLAGHQLEAGRELRVARRHAPLIEEILTPIEASLGEESESKLDIFEFLVGIGPAWKAHPAVTAWLGAGGLAPGDEELRQAKASYPAPVDALLMLGPIELGKHSIDYLQHGLQRAHVADLTRMMVDPALQFADSDSTTVWAPLHALRALAQLRAPEAVEPLLNWLRDEELDEWFLDEMPGAMARIGPVTIPQLVALMNESGANIEARRSALSALEEIVKLHPDRAQGILDDARALLRLHGTNPIPINSYIVGMLAWNGTTADIPLITAVHAEGRMDEFDCGSLEDCIAQLRMRGDGSGST